MAVKTKGRQRDRQVDRWIDCADFTRATYVVSAVYAPATWLAGWLGVYHTPVLYQNG